MQVLPKEVWTIGHSNRTLDEFTAMLQSFNIQMLVDVRHFPASRKFPYFNKEALRVSLQQNNIQYEHILELGGRRKQNKESGNTAWRHPAFRAYADYMETAEFEQGARKLKDIAQLHRTAYMCSEAVWWSCHRSMISDYLKAEEWTVMHIMSIAKEEEHPYTSPAKVQDGKLTYR
ncbi:DUF488 family protein [Aridibaculum aurantiacum]|uniref:DUF488 domain-containing protein n=1 Tax=Aridibaculum aurantiacum TaxID=2810307 RepID=UPI001A979C57|nr:DUF488 domain-containing protein [Aridibaculum aurantiacum]